jgi:nucleoside-diphosphate-sugar epimerase
MKVIVFGGTGFIGSGIVKSLADKGHEVIVGTRSPSFQINEAAYTIKRVEYTSVEAVEDFIAEHDFVINCIANVHGEDMSLDSFRRVEVSLTETIAKACLNVGIPLIQLSSIIAFGRKLPEAPIDESFVGSDFEMIDKVCIEREEMIKSIFQDTNKFLILRPVPIIGSKDKGGTLRRVFDLYPQGSFPIVEGGLASVTFADKRDLGNAVELAIRSFDTIKGKTFIVGGFNANWLQIKQALDSHYGINQTYLSLTKTDAESKLGLRIAEFISSPRLYNDQKFRQATGFLPYYTLNDAIESYLSI